MTGPQVSETRPTLHDLRARASTLRLDGEYLLLRGNADKQSKPVLVLATASDQPSPRSIERLKHEYALRNDLDPAWAAKPLTIEQELGHTLLVLADPGGELLSGRLGQPWGTGTFLRVAIGIAVALGRVHAQGLIHKDVKPDHLLVDLTTGAAWLTGFGIASQLARERQMPDVPETIAGTLAYMAPEQTGRMNRSIDARSDLYALGVTLYQLLTGSLPFTATDPVELVHCHIAHRPVPPVERAPGVPPALSAVVMKLLAKTADDRYQTAAGVVADLRRCLATHESGGNIEGFSLGAHDIPAPAEGLEFASVVKMSQAVSGEIMLEKLIEKLLSIALEYAGAQRGLLIVPQGDVQRIQAEAAIGGEKMKLGIRNAQVTPADMPESILRYVIRTHTSVLLDDVSLPNPYSSDPYITGSRPRSILCLPLLKQARLIGVLYLENPLAARVFTPTRTAVLNLLASQAAISLENARLYADLQKENADRGQSEEALRRSQERYALAVQAAGDGHTEWIAATDELYASPRLLEMHGLPLDAKFAGRADLNARINYHPDDRDRAVRTFNEFYAGVATRLELDVRILRHGETRWLHVTVLCSRDVTGAVQRSNAAVTDVTERKVSEERFALAVAGANEGIFDWDLLTDRLYLSQRAQELFSLPAGELWRQRREWLKQLNFHPDDWKLQHDSLKALIAGEAPTYDVEFRVILPDGSHRWFRQRGIALRDEAGKAYRMVGSIGDITDRKRAQEELLRLERRLRQSQRLEAMGNLAGGIAHDFNNVLGAVLGYAEMALRDASPGSRLRRDLESITTAGEHGRALVDRVLAFSRSGVGERVSVHVEKVVREALDLLAHKLPTTVRVDAQLTSGRAALLGDPTQVHQVVMNLVTNAVHAMPQGGLLSVHVNLVRFEAASASTIGGVDAGEYIMLRVADTGTGIAPEIFEHIFDPFFTTKEVGTGTGLGLSLVHGIVMQVGGAIDVASTVGSGSTFTVYLPRSGDASEPEQGAEVALPRGEGQCVLVVDDEELLVKVATRTLEDLGYAPVGFTSSTAALTAFRNDPQRFDVVITDERMPRMRGSALIEAVRAVRRDVPILLMSGYVGGAVMSHARKAGADDVLKKPLLARDLAASLARVFHP
jgi:PAS domain S-box-containing protein